MDNQKIIISKIINAIENLKSNEKATITKIDGDLTIQISPRCKDQKY
jgi:hypothetical protein